MNVLVVADSADRLVSERDNISRHVDLSQDTIYYFCSSIKEDYKLPVELEDKLIKIVDYMEGHKERYDDFLKETDALYGKLCEKFSSVYSEVLRGLDLRGILRWGTCAFLMDFLRVYNFLKYVMVSDKIDRVIVLSPDGYIASHKNGLFGYLEAFPIDSSMASLSAGELGIECVDLKVKIARPVMPFFIASLKGFSKDVSRYICYAFLKIKDLFVLKQSRRNANIVCFGSLGHLLSTIKEINRSQSINVYFYHSHPLIKESYVIQQNNMRQVSWQYDSLAIRLRSLFNKAVTVKIAKKFKKNFKDTANENMESFLALLLNEYFEYNIPDFMHKLDMYTNLLNKIRPKAALLDENTSPLRKPFEFAARARKVPVFIIEHGTPANTFPVSLYKDIADFAYLFVGGEFIRDLYRDRHKANADKMIVTGTPRYDDIHHFKKDKTSARPTICFAPTFLLKRGTTYNFTDYVLNCKKNINMIARKYKEGSFDLIVKFHPGDPHENIVKNEFAALGVKAVYITDQLKSIDVLKSSNLLLTCWSTIALEGCLLGLPVIIMNSFPGLPEHMNFVKDGIATFARTPEMLGSLIDDYMAGVLKNMTDDARAKSASFGYEKFQDDMASRRVADFILSKIGDKRS